MFIIVKDKQGEGGRGGGGEETTPIISRVNKVNIFCLPYNLTDTSQFFQPARHSFFYFNHLDTPPP